MRPPWTAPGPTGAGPPLSRGQIPPVLTVSQCAVMAAAGMGHLMQAALSRGAGAPSRSQACGCATAPPPFGRLRTCLSTWPPGRPQLSWAAQVLTAACPSVFLLASLRLLGNRAAHIGNHCCECVVDSSTTSIQQLFATAVADQRSLLWAKDGSVRHGSSLRCRGPLWAQGRGSPPLSGRC